MSEPQDQTNAAEGQSELTAVVIYGITDNLPERCSSGFSKEVLVLIDLGGGNRYVNIDRFDYDLNDWMKNKTTNGVNVIAWAPKPEISI